MDEIVLWPPLEGKLPMIRVYRKNVLIAEKVMSSKACASLAIDLLKAINLLTK